MQRLLTSGTLLLALVAGAEAQSYEEVVLGYLDYHIEENYPGWVEMPNSYFSYELDEGHGTAVMLENLTPGDAVYVVAACDDDCTDLDLYVYEGGKEIAIETDLGDSEFPAVLLVPEFGKTYTYMVVATRCQAEPCYIAAKVIS